MKYLPSVVISQLIRKLCGALEVRSLLLDLKSSMPIAMILGTGQSDLTLCQNRRVALPDDRSKFSLQLQFESPSDGRFHWIQTEKC